jgi:pyruvate formate lyase activating enzyme
MKENLEFLLASCGAERILVRVPYIPGFNTAEDQARSAEALREMGAMRLEVFEYVVRAE